MTTHRLRTTLLTGAAALASAGTAHAQSTPAGTVISNQAQASYTVNGTAQTAASNTATFVVDRKVNFTVVTAQSANTQVNLGQTGAVTTYTVTNKTNGTQDFILDPDQQNLSVGILPGTDNFDVGNMRAYVDSNNNGVYDSTKDCFTDVNGNGVWDADPGISGQGGANDVAIYTFTVNYPRIFPVFALMGLGSAVTLTASTVLKNQPWATQATYTPKQICPS